MQCEGLGWKQTPSDVKSWRPIGRNWRTGGRDSGQVEAKGEKGRLTISGLELIKEGKTSPVEEKQKMAKSGDVDTGDDQIEGIPSL